MERFSFPKWLRASMGTAILLALAFCLAIALGVNAQPSETKVEASVGKVIVINGNRADTNLATFTRTDYVGQCPGSVIVSGGRSTQFVSSSAPPAPNRRVIVRNVTEGMNSNPYPYTDREYDKGRYSEGFSLFPGNSHDEQTFAVLEGENQLEYQIREGDRPIEQGSFTISVSITDTGTFSRNTICEETLRCEDVYRDCSNGGRGNRRQCYPTTTCKCP